MTITSNLNQHKTRISMGKLKDFISDLPVANTIIFGKLCMYNTVYRVGIDRIVQIVNLYLNTIYK